MRAASLRRRRPEEAAGTDRWRGRGQGGRWPGGRDPGRDRPAAAGPARICDVNTRSSSACARRTSTSPAAASRKASQRYLVRTINQFATLDEMREMLVSTAGGVPVQLQATSPRWTQGYKEREAIIRMRRPGSGRAGHLQGRRRQHRQRGRRVVKAAGASARTRCPQGAELTTIDDQSIFIKQRDPRRQVRRASIGGLLSILMIFLFLRDGLEHVRHRAVAAGVDHRHLLLHGPVRPRAST